MREKVYLDHVSTTKPYPEVIKTYSELLTKYYCNSDALYDEGVTLFRMQEKARAKIAELLKVKAQEIIFTGGASEANALAIKGTAVLNLHKRHIISSIYEHSSVYNALKQLEELLNFEVTYLKPDKDGRITAQAVKEAIRPDTCLVSIMAVNNEVGIINDYEAIGAIVRKYSKALFHCDMTQALAKLPLNLDSVDLASFSAHKIHGLKGSGFLYKRANVKIAPLINGGQQEFGLRGGTSNTLVNILLAKTLRLALDNYQRGHAKVEALHDYFCAKLQAIKGVKVNTNAYCLKGIINISLPLTSEVALNALNAAGIMVSAKSTCGTRLSAPSRTYTALGIDGDHSLRISLDRENTVAEIDYFSTCLKEIVNKYGR